MVGIFSKFSGGRIGHRRTQSAVDARQTLAQNVEVLDPAPVPTAHVIETTVEFKPVEHPTEPTDCDQPVKCPLPEPSILNDGRIWKERMSSVSARFRGDLPVVKEGPHLEPEAVAGSDKPRPSPTKRGILPSLSAPEHDLIKLLDDCNVAQDHSSGFRS
ncbi:uncharacterized protein A4U43_C10F810 [Asparagus officinalis]|uniref:Uncharacterized protein n=1 Tax=Asparagus officinalis TaxID=4686 RepID=A0A5P1DZL4_ASPOF|nr:uncharacterized protein LOC109826174 isoform X1 [Asparagus officinalis]XP_020248755.1 uncharacterized protein LOC109826174 isoform X1 [Asparagus officinalis]ONK55770.1 uncharacterized protein A4U43_C10F810 [Asparagus officinalis]